MGDGTLASFDLTHSLMRRNCFLPFSVWHGRRRWTVKHTLAHGGTEGALLWRGSESDACFPSPLSIQVRNRGGALFPPFRRLVPAKKQSSLWTVWGGIWYFGLPYKPLIKQSKIYIKIRSRFCSSVPLKSVTFNPRVFNERMSELGGLLLEYTQYY